MKGEWVKTEKFVLGPFWSFLESRMKFLKVQSLLPKSRSVLWLVYFFNHSFQLTFVGRDCVTSQKNICKGGYNTTYKGITIRVGTINLSLAESLSRSLCLRSWHCYTKEINLDYFEILLQVKCRIEAVNSWEQSEVSALCRSKGWQTVKPDISSIWQLSPDGWYCQSW